MMRGPIVGLWNQWYCLPEGSDLCGKIKEEVQP